MYSMRTVANAEVGYRGESLRVAPGHFHHKKIYIFFVSVWMMDVNLL